MIGRRKQPTNISLMILQKLSRAIENTQNAWKWHTRTGINLPAIKILVCEENYNTRCNETLCEPLACRYVPLQQKHNNSGAAGEIQETQSNLPDSKHAAYGSH